MAERYEDPRLEAAQAASEYLGTLGSHLINADSTLTAVVAAEHDPAVHFILEIDPSGVLLSLTEVKGSELIPHSSDSFIFMLAAGNSREIPSDETKIVGIKLVAGLSDTGVGLCSVDGFCSIVPAADGTETEGPAEDELAMGINLFSDGVIVITGGEDRDLEMQQTLEPHTAYHIAVGFEDGPKLEVTIEWSPEGIFYVDTVHGEADFVVDSDGYWLSGELTAERMVWSIVASEEI